MKIFKNLDWQYFTAIFHGTICNRGSDFLILDRVSGHLGGSAISYPLKGSSIYITSRSKWGKLDPPPPCHAIVTFSFKYSTPPSWRHVLFLFSVHPPVKRFQLFSKVWLISEDNVLRKFKGGIQVSVRWSHHFPLFVNAVCVISSKPHGNCLPFLLLCNLDTSLYWRDRFIIEWLGVDNKKRWENLVRISDMN